MTSFSTKISTPTTLSNDPEKTRAISLLNLAPPIIRAILSILFSDCIAKYDIPAWYSNARVILHLSPEEEDWLEARYRGFPDAEALATATWTPDAPVWHAEAVREYRRYRHLKLEHDPAPVLAWLDNEQSMREEGKVDVGIRDVQLAERYLMERGFKAATIKRFQLEGYVNIGDDCDGDDEADGPDGDGNDGAVMDGVQDEVVETVEMEDAVMADVDAGGHAKVNAELSPVRDEATSHLDHVEDA